MSHGFVVNIRNEIEDKILALAGELTSDKDIDSLHDVLNTVRKLADYAEALEQVARDSRKDMQVLEKLQNWLNLTTRDVDGIVDSGGERFRKVAEFNPAFAPAERK